MSIFIDPASLSGGADGACQVAFLFFVYAFLLYTGSNMISDGSELLLLIPWMAGIVGSVVLPVLGAVPDAAIVLFSGFGSDAQSQLEVGIGALAGSTIMLMTIPWFLSVYAGRVNIDVHTGHPVYKRPPGQANWAKLQPPDNASLTGTGVANGQNVRVGGVLMLITATPYLIIQGPAIFYSGDSDSQVSNGEHWFAFTGLFLCFILFVGYLYYAWWLAYNDGAQVLEDFTEEVCRARILKGEISLLGVLGDELASKSDTDKAALAEEANVAATGNTPKGNKSPRLTEQLIPSSSLKRLESLLRPFFERYDTDNSGHLQIQELKQVFSDLHENVSQRELTEIFAEFDSDHSGTVDFPEFVAGVAKFAASALNSYHAPEVPAYELSQEALNEGDAEEQEEIPADFLALSPQEQQRAIMMRAMFHMSIGTAIVLLFSDPMVDVLDEIGTRIGISSFYVSFVLAPLASNGSELIASYNYSKKKTSKTIQIALATLQGACCMNSTFCLGVFMILIFFKDLAWVFSAETTSILCVIVIMAIVSQRKQTQRLLDACLVLTLYPLSILLVVLLNSIGWD